MKFRAIAILAALALPAVAAQPGTKLTSIRIEPQGRTLAGAGASQQLLVIAEFSDGAERDLTDHAVWKLSDPSLARIDNDARLFALVDGTVTVTATVEGRSARSPMRIEHAQTQRPFSFGRDIEGIFTRRGCNAIACHGSVKGRGGFKLSANALNPREDYEWITKGGGYQVLIDAPSGARVPRVDVHEPTKSLLLLKPSMVVAHGGGLKLPKDSDDYRTILAWAKKDAPFGEVSPAQVTSLEVTPRLVAFPASGRHRLLVTAHLADGSREDFTREVVYQVNNTEVATVTSAGVVSGIKSGETAVLVRAAGQTASAVVGVIGASASAYPEVPRTNFIDDYIFSKLRKFHIEPSDLSRDDEFLRRVCLDLTGTLPPPARVRQFLASKDRNKRDKLIETLMATPEFVDYWTFRFSDLFRVSVAANGRSMKWSEMYSQWLRDSIATNKPYDQIARERVAAEGYDGPSRHFLPNTVLAPAAETSAEQVRVFLGRRLDCAQCHNHPYENWTQNQFWGLAAFFDRVFILSNTLTDSVIFDHPTGEDLGSADVRGSIKLYHPRTKAEVKPAFLDGTIVPPSDHVNPRRAFASWITAHPYFAEAAVNRVWSWFFGRGLVEPVDDFRSTNPSTHPELLEKLAADFRDHGHDLRRLMRLIVASRAYQLSGVPNDTNKDDEVNYSHAIPRPLDAEVLLDTISDVTGVPEVFTTSVSDAPAANAGQAPLGTRAINLHEADVYYSRFLELYGRPNRLTVPARSTKASLGQALDMLAGPAYNEKLMAKGSRLGRLLASGEPDAKIIEELYLAALGRLPTRGETTDLLKLIDRKDGQEAALKDFIWALISSREFAENH
jgi:hypothetical protein